MLSLCFILALGHHPLPLAPNAALGHLVRDVPDPRAVRLAPLSIQSARQKQPGIEVVAEANLHSLEHFHVVRRAKTRWPEKALVATHAPLIQFRLDPLKQRRIEVDLGLRGTNRAHHPELHSDHDQVRKDQQMGSSAVHQLFSALVAVARSHRLAVFVRTLHDAEYLAVAIAFAIVKHDMPMTEVTGHRNRAAAEMASRRLHASAAHHSEEGLVYKVRMVTVHRVFNL